MRGFPVSRLGTRKVMRPSGPGVAPPSLAFSIMTAIFLSVKRFGRGCKPRPASDGKLELLTPNSQAGAWELALAKIVTSFPRAAWECSIGALRREAVVKIFSACVNLIWKRVAMDIPQPFITAIHTRKLGRYPIEPVKFRKPSFLAGAIPLVHRPV